MSPIDIRGRLQQHDRDHAEHKAAVAAWLVMAGFHASIEPCRCTLHIDSVGVWCGNSMLNASRAIEIHWTLTHAHAAVKSYGGHRTFTSATGATPVDALCALVATGKVPIAFLKGPR